MQTTASREPWMHRQLCDADEGQGSILLVPPYSATEGAHDDSLSRGARRRQRVNGDGDCASPVLFFFFFLFC